MSIVIKGILFLQPCDEAPDFLIFEQPVYRVVVMREFFLGKNRVYFVMADAMHPDLLAATVAAWHEMVFID